MEWQRGTMGLIDHLVAAAAAAAGDEIGREMIEEFNLTMGNSKATTAAVVAKAITLGT
jgi:hypothetical protein